MTQEEKRKEKNKCYYEKNKEKRKLEYQENKEDLKQKSKEYKDNNKEIVKEQRKNYREKNKVKINLYFKERKKNDILFRLKCNLRVSIRNFLKVKKTSKTEQILGCSFDDFKLYIESKFDDWMNWDNYGKYNGELNFGWDIDHIIPIGNTKDIFKLLELNHYTNLQPLCSKINREIKRGVNPFI